MIERCLALGAIGCLMLPTFGGLPPYSTAARRSEPALRTPGGLELSPVISRDSLSGGELADKTPYKAVAAQAARTQAALRNFKTDWMDTFIPDGAAPLITSLKHQLRDVILNVLNARSPEPVSPDVAQSIVLSSLASQGVKVEQPHSTDLAPAPGEHEYVYGDIYEVTVRQPTSDPDLLAITTTLGVCCGDDTSLYLVRRQGQRWALIIADEADGYTEVNGAQGNFQYYVAEPDAEGNFFLVTAGITPWCTSNWQELRYKVTRPGSDARTPRVLMTAKDVIYLQDDPIFELSGDPTGFSLRFQAGYSLDPGVFARDHILRYQVQGNQTLRVNPVAGSARDFLDEWINMPWEEAKRWSDPSTCVEQRHWHAFLHDNKCWSTDGLSFVQPCESAASGHGDANPTEWQIGVDISPAGSDVTDAGDPSGINSADSADSIQPRRAAPLQELCVNLPSTLFFTITRNADGFMMEQIASLRPPGCRGETSLSELARSKLKLELSTSARLLHSCPHSRIR